MISTWTAAGLDATLDGCRLDDFDAMWSLELGFVEEPNVRRGGWSGVSVAELSTANGRRTVYVKRQANHVIRSVFHPVRGEPTLHREFDQLRRFRGHDIRVPEPLHYAHRTFEGEWRAILIVAEVPGISLEDWVESSYGTSDRVTRVAIIAAVAAVCRSMWDLRFEHRALYPKHLFLDLDREPVAAGLIDLEKTRHRQFHPSFRVRDLDALNRRTPRVSRTDRLRFLCRVLGARSSDPRVRRCWRRLVARAAARRVRPGRGQ